MEIDMSEQKKAPNNYQSSLYERINRLAWDKAAAEDARRKACFAQARRYAKQKPVTLPKLAWMDKNA